MLEYRKTKLAVADAKADTEEVSVGAHARRTRLLYELAFGPETEIGIIAVPDRNYDPRRWWASSAGVRDVVDETVAYLYARFLFDPPAE